MESRESYEKNSDSRFYNNLVSAGKKLGRLGAAGLVGLFSYLPSAYAIQNTGVDSDYDGASDSFETSRGSNPSVYDSLYGNLIPDGLQIGYDPLTNPGVVTTFYDPHPDKVTDGSGVKTFVSGQVTHENGRYEFAVGHNLMSDRLYFIRGTVQDGPDVTGPGGIPDGIPDGKELANADLYRVDVGNSASEIPLTTGGHFKTWNMDTGSSNATNTGVYFSDNGAINEFFDDTKMSPRIVLQPASGESYYNPVLYNHSTLGYHLLVNVIPSSGDGLLSVINAYPLKDGVADPADFSKVVDMTLPANGWPQQGSFYARPNLSGNSLLWLGFSSASPRMRIYVTKNSDLENIIANKTIFYENEPVNNVTRIDTSDGLFPLGWSGSNVLMLIDEENAFIPYSLSANNLLDGTTDFDLRVWNTENGTLNSYILWPDNQFGMVLFPDKRFALTNFNGGVGGSEGKIDYGVLESAVSLLGGAKSFTSNLSFVTDAGLDHFIPAGTSVSIPFGNPPFIYERANFVIGAKAGNVVVREVESSPSGTIFDNSGTHLVEFPVNKDILNYLGKDIMDPTAVSVTLTTGTGTELLTIISRDPVNSTISGYVDHFSNSTIEVNGVTKTLNDTDGDGISDVDETDVYLTQPLVWDTDNDGLSDGQEVNTYGTQPTVYDTDGDGVSDGHEIIFGTNPLNPLDFPNLPVDNRCGRFGLVSLLGMAGGSYLIKRRYRSPTSN
ncbi:MAG: hypothetical protein AABW91_04410 [Nanoarchaeota archaeon]